MEPGVVAALAAVFAECRRVLKPDGVMTLMFTHKATGAWDALTTGLIEAGFAITASWPVNTEAGGSLHIRDKAAANSTVFLVCRQRAAADPAAGAVCGRTSSRGCARRCPAPSAGPPPRPRRGLTAGRRDRDRMTAWLAGNTRPP